MDHCMIFQPCSSAQGPGRRSNLRGNGSGARRREAAAILDTANRQLAGLQLRRQGHGLPWTATSIRSIEAGVSPPIIVDFP
jgi:hypothetical protein